MGQLGALAARGWPASFECPRPDRFGNAIAPHNIIAGAATVGLVGRDGEVLARTLIPVLAYTAFAGVIVLIISRQV